MAVLKRYSVFIFLLLVLFSCDYKENKVAPEADFVKYIDLSSANKIISPLDARLDTDGGIIVLCNADITQPYVVKLSDKGELLWESELSSPYYRANANLISSNNEFYFTSFNNDGSNGSFLFKVNTGSGELVLNKQLEDITYTLATAELPNGGMLLQSYDPDGRKTVLTKYNAAFNEVWQEKFNIYEDLEIPTIFNHVTGRSAPLPFFCGVMMEGGKEKAYYFNGFSNYNLALTLITTAKGEELGVVQGNRYEAAISSATNIEGNKFAFSRFSEDGRNFLVPSTDVNVSSYSQGTELGGDLIPHWEDRGLITSATFLIGSTEVVGFIGNTKSGKLELRVYSTEGAYLGSKFLGGTNFIGFGKLLQAADGGVTVIAQAAFEDRFFKLAYFKLSQETLADIID